MQNATCKFAFSSPEEENEWIFLQCFLRGLDEELLPLPIRIEHSENVNRIKRHGYSLRSTSTPNEYELTNGKD